METIAVENTAAYVSFCFPSFKDAENLLLENYKVNNLQSYTEMKRSLDRLNKFLNIDVLEVFTSWIGGEVAIIKPRLENDQKADHIVLAIRSKRFIWPRIKWLIWPNRFNGGLLSGRGRWSLTGTRFIISG